MIESSWKIRLSRSISLAMIASGFASKAVIPK